MSLELSDKPDLDQLELSMVQAGLPTVECKVEHLFAPGLYVRTCHIPAGTMLTTMIHKTEHPFIISDGVAEVTSEIEGSIVLAAPHRGITKPGTRRAIRALTDVVWTTVHATDLTDVEAIGEAILEPHRNPLLPDGIDAAQWDRNKLA